MTNHPNRNWRTRMQAACAEYLATFRWMPAGTRMISDADLREFAAGAYRIGYESGRASVQRKPA